MEPERRGRVSLVGAGPGDPELLTLRAAALLAEADVVAYDLLVPAALIERAGPQAELIAVGRRGHGAHGTQADYRLHPDVLARAQAGLHVVRLKAGDPFVFGRGGEEAEELLEAGIPFEIVPGVSAALGAAAGAGIPLTHRAFASDLVFATGHAARSGGGGHTAWEHVGGGRGTVVMYMAVLHLAANVERLITGGRAPETPAAYVASASTPDQRVIVATLATLEAALGDIDRRAPALVIVGDVVGLRAKLAWLEARPLFGRRVVVGRARPSLSRVAAALRALGAEVWEVPTVTCAPPTSYAALDAALREPARASAIVFASAEAVTATLRRLGETRRDVRDLPRLPLFAIGEATGARLAESGLVADVCAEGACADAVARLGERATKHAWLVLGGEAGRPTLLAELAALGVRTEYAAAYRARYAFPRVELPKIDAVVLPSSSTAQLVLDGPLASSLRASPVIAMGQRTEASARALGARAIVRATADTPAALVAAVHTALTARGPS